MKKLTKYGGVYQFPDDAVLFCVAIGHYTWDNPIYLFPFATIVKEDISLIKSVIDKPFTPESFFQFLRRLKSKQNMVTYSPKYMKPYRPSFEDILRTRGLGNREYVYCFQEEDALLDSEEFYSKERKKLNIKRQLNLSNP